MKLNRTALLELIQRALGDEVPRIEPGGQSFSVAGLSDVYQVNDPEHVLANLCMKSLHTDDPIVLSCWEAKAILVARGAASATDDEMYGGHFAFSGRRFYFLANLSLKEIVIEDSNSPKFWVVKPEPIV